MAQFSSSHLTHADADRVDWLYLWVVNGKAQRRKSLTFDSFDLQVGKKLCRWAVNCIAHHYVCDGKKEAMCAIEMSLWSFTSNIRVYFSFFSIRGSVRLSYSKSNQNTFRIDDVDVSVPPGDEQYCESEITSHCAINSVLCIRLSVSDTNALFCDSFFDSINFCDVT